MTTFDRTTQKSCSKSRTASASLFLLAVAAVSFVCPSPCLAQPAYFVPPPPASAAQPSAIPPEVVPLAPAPAPTDAYSAQSRDYTPGLLKQDLNGAGPSTTMSGMTAQQARQAAFNQLMGNQQWTPQLGEQLQAQGRQLAAQQASAAPNSQALGPNNFIANNAPGNGQQAVGNTDYSDTQTLTGGVKYKQYYYNTQRSGFSNATSANVGFVASGMAYPWRVTTVGASNGLGLPFFLLGATGLRW